MNQRSSELRRVLIELLAPRSNGHHPRTVTEMDGVSLLQQADFYWKKAFAARKAKSRGVLNKSTARARKFERKAVKAFEERPKR